MTTTEHPTTAPLFAPCPPWCRELHPWTEYGPDTWGRIHESVTSTFGAAIWWNEVKRTDGTPVENVEADDRVHVWVDCDVRLTSPAEVRAYLADVAALAAAAFPGHSFTTPDGDKPANVNRLTAAAIRLRDTLRSVTR